MAATIAATTTMATAIQIHGLCRPLSGLRGLRLAFSSASVPDLRVLISVAFLFASLLVASVLLVLAVVASTSSYAPLYSVIIASNMAR
jgi:hypothetical protein